MEVISEFSSLFLFLKIQKNGLLTLSHGPVSVGKNQPTMVVTIPTTTAINRDFNQPAVYSFCSAGKNTIPVMIAAIHTWFGNTL